MVIALDGPAGVGKSTIAKMIAEKADFFYLNSGNFYRTVTYAAIENGSTTEDEIIRTASNCRISIVNERFHLNGEDIHDLLHSDSIDARVAGISSIVEVRSIVNDMLKAVASGIDSVVEGRDMTTVVFPDADVKFYLDASVSTRARRRYAQGTSNLSLEEIEESIRRRDQIDKNKTVGSLKISDDSVYLDTSDLTIDQVCEKVLSKITIDNRPRS